MSNKNDLERKNLTRRDLIRAGGLGIVASALLPLPIKSQGSSSPEGKKAKSGRVAPDGGNPSVFQRCGGDFTTNEGSIKYANGDRATTFPIYALWVMLTTENWEKCFADPSWEKDLYEELFHQYLQSNPGSEAKHDSIIKQLKNVRQVFTDNQDVFGAVGAKWRNFVVSDSTFYGDRPCPGGGTIRGIAGLTPAPIQRSPKSRKTKHGAKK